MERSIFCPICQRKNSADATQCAFCGVQFVVDRTESFTTERVTELHSALLGPSSRCAEYLPSLPQDGLALFVMNEPEPIIIKDAGQIVLGRHVEGEPRASVDLTEYGAMEMGVSRQHAQITVADGNYTVVDLGSTNGSWLNQRRMTAGKPYPLHANDQLLLGHLRLHVCFHSDAVLSEVVFNITDTTFTTPILARLTPQYLAGTIIPYLQAVIEVQRVCNEFQGSTPSEVHVKGLTAVKDESLMIVSLDGAAEAVRLVRKWVVPWRKLYDVLTEAKDSETEQQLQLGLRQLAKKMLGNVASDSSSVDIDAFSATLATPLNLLVTSPLKITTETR